MEYVFIFWHVKQVHYDSSENNDEIKTSQLDILFLKCHYRETRMLIYNIILWNRGADCGQKHLLKLRSNFKSQLSKFCFWVFIMIYNSFENIRCVLLRLEFLHHSISSSGTLFLIFTTHKHKVTCELIGKLISL